MREVREVREVRGARCEVRGARGARCEVRPLCARYVHYLHDEELLLHEDGLDQA